MRVCRVSGKGDTPISGGTVRSGARAVLFFKGYMEMTWSVVARDAVTGEFGVAVASRFFAVGSLIAHAASGIGAIASQAFVNPQIGIGGLKLLREGYSAPDVLDKVAAADPGIDFRQVHIVDRNGETAGLTGAECRDWCGGISKPGVSVYGNMLVGPEVIEATQDSYMAHRDLPFAERLIEALAAGDDVGGDRRGRQSASLLVYRDRAYPWLDLRVDDHANPIQELRRLNDVAQERYLRIVERMATEANPGGVLDRESLEQEMAQLDRDIAEGRRTTASYATDLP